MGIWSNWKRRLDSKGYKIYTAVQIQNEAFSIVFQFAESMGTGRPMSIRIDYQIERLDANGLRPFKNTVRKWFEMSKIFGLNV